MNHVKEVLRRGGVAVGASAWPWSPVDFLADAGFDFLLFDTQHSPVEIKELREALEAMRGRRASPVVRVGQNIQDQVCYALDIGAKGIIVPMVNTREEASAMVDWCKYPPEGRRSSAGVRGEWGSFSDYREYMDAVNRELLVVPMVETREALDNLEEILSVPGIDVLLVGPSDLSINLGMPLDYGNPEYQKALDRIAEASMDHGVVPGMYFIPPSQDPRGYIERGFRFFTLPWKPMASKGIQEGLQDIKK